MHLGAKISRIRDNNFIVVLKRIFVLSKYLDVAEYSEPDFSGGTPTRGKQGNPYSFQGSQADCGQGPAQAEEEAESGRHDGRVGTDQGAVQHGEDVKELILRLRLVALEDLKHLALTPHVTILQPM